MGPGEVPGATTTGTGPAGGAPGPLRVGWVDASAGASGDMLLGALGGAGVPVEVIAEAVDRVAPDHVGLRTEPVTRAGFAATRCHVEVADTAARRTWRDVERLLAAAGLTDAVHARAHRAFSALAEAEASVHGTTPEEVHFHEVGALDAIADVVGVCAGLEHLGLEELVVSPVAVGSGRTAGAHGTMSVPAPAVALLLRGVPSYAGPVPREMCTPTGAALLVTSATGYGPQPPMVAEQVGAGAGHRDPPEQANVLRLFVGVSTDSTTGVARSAPAGGALVLETNVDDLDPRLWPDVLARLLAAGASDAWLTPILMKKGRPAHTLSVLVRPELAGTVRRTVYAETSTIGMREHVVAKQALDRETRHVQVEGQSIAVKLARLDGELLNVQPEYDEVVAAARALDRPIKDVLARAIAASRGED